MSFKNPGLLCTFLIQRVDTVSFQLSVSWVQLSLIPYFLKALSPPPLKSPTSFEWSWFAAFHFLSRCEMTPYVWFNWFNEFTFYLPSRERASPSRCVFVWLVLWTLCNMLVLYKRQSCRSCSSATVWGWFSADSSSKRCCLKHSWVCQVGWNVTYAVWPHCWIPQKSCLRSQVDEIYFDLNWILIKVFLHLTGKFSLKLLFIFTIWTSLMSFWCVSCVSSELKNHAISYIEHRLFPVWGISQ